MILITGASSGIGEATARRLAREPGASLVLLARREDRLAALAAELGASRTSTIAVDLVDEDAPERVREHVAANHGRLDLLVNNAGAAWRARFAEGGWENVRRTMAINFDAQVRLTEALLPMLRESAPSAIVNVSSGFISTEGFPQSELTARPLTRRIVSTPERAAEAIYEAGLGRRPERYVPRPYWLAAAVRILAPALYRRVIGGGAAELMTTTTGADLAERANGAGRSPGPPGGDSLG